MKAFVRKENPFCWECGSPLSSYENGSMIYEIVTDPLGNQHKVHKTCLGRRDLKVTAQPREIPVWSPSYADRS